MKFTYIFLVFKHKGMNVTSFEKVLKKLSTDVLLMDTVRTRTWKWIVCSFFRCRNVDNLSISSLYIRTISSFVTFGLLSTREHINSSSQSDGVPERNLSSKSKSPLRNLRSTFPLFSEQEHVLNIHISNVLSCGFNIYFFIEFT